MYVLIEYFTYLGLTLAAALALFLIAATLLVVTEAARRLSHAWHTHRQELLSPLHALADLAHVFVVRAHSAQHTKS